MKTTDQRMIESTCLLKAKAALLYFPTLESTLSLVIVCRLRFIDSADKMIWSDVSLKGDIIAAGFNNSLVKLWIYKCDVTREEKDNNSDNYKDDDKKDDEQLNEADKQAKLKAELLQKEKELKISNHRVEEIDCIGHTGPIYAVSISYDGQILLSGSHDTSIRLWAIPVKKSLTKLSSLAIFKGHTRPVWDIKFSPFGYYFASGSADWMAMVWVTTKITPIRLLWGKASIYLVKHLTCLFKFYTLIKSHVSKGIEKM